jgi:hypothetical protein
MELPADRIRGEQKIRLLAPRDDVQVQVSVSVIVHPRDALRSTASRRHGSERRCVGIRRFLKPQTCVEIDRVPLPGGIGHHQVRISILVEVDPSDAAGGASVVSDATLGDRNEERGASICAYRIADIR